MPGRPEAPQRLGGHRERGHPGLSRNHMGDPVGSHLHHGRGQLARPRARQARHGVVRVAHHGDIRGSLRQHPVLNQ
eukprot:scaffold123986_cov37-Prasinocladus_malaysianus.AAC.1